MLQRFGCMGILLSVLSVAGSSTALAADKSPIEVLGLSMKTEASAADTEGSMSVVGVQTPPGSGPPAHIHRHDDELFIVIEGEYRFWIDGKPAIDAGAGDVIFMPKGVAHQYLNVGSQSGRHYFVTVPGGLDGLFSEIHSGHLEMPRDKDKIIELSAKYGIDYVPPLAPK